MLVAVCVAATGALLLSAPAFAARGHFYGSSFAEAGTGNGQLTEPDGVAVEEATGDVYVVDKGNDRVEYFNASGVYEGQFDGSGTLAGEVKAAPSGKFSKPEQIAIDNDPASPSYGDVYVGDTGHNAIDKFSPTGKYIGQLTDAGSGVPLTEIRGLADDAEGQLWVAFDNQSAGGVFNRSVAHFDGAVANGLIALTELVEGAGAFLERVGLAVDAEDRVYVVMSAFGRETLLQEFASDGSALDEEVIQTELRGIGGLSAELSSNDVYVDELTSVVRLSPEHTQIERLGTGDLTSGTGIGIDEASETLYVADSATNEIDVFEPEPPGKPAVEGESVSDVASTSATLIGEVNPRGASTEYAFEYGPCTTLAGCATSPYDETSPVPDGALAGTFTTAAVTIHPQDLQPATTYHFRVVASSQLGVAPSAGEQTFTTQPAGSSLHLLDDRAWELVSPTNKHGALINALGLTTVQAAADGSAISYQTSTPTDSEAEGYSFEGAQIVSTRGLDGWSSRDITTRHETVTGIENGSEYDFFSPDLSHALVNPLADDGGQTDNTTLLSPHASAATPYIRSQASCEGDVPAASECFLPLFTGKEGYEDVPSGTVFGTETTNALSVEAVTSSLDHVVVVSSVALTETPTTNEELYEWFEGVPADEAVQLVSVLPEAEGGEPALGTEVIAGGDIQSALPGLKGARHAISNDGSRVFWETRSPNALYMRDVLRGETIRLDVKQAGAPAGGSAEPTFQFASADGSKVFFTDGQSLTADSGAGDLYLCEIVEEAGKDACHLTDLTPKAGSESAEVRQLVLGAGEDGSYIYFVANGALGAGATKGQCRQYEVSSAMCNLYVAHEQAGAWTVKFIAVLSIEDLADWGTDGSPTPIGGLTARVSPSGRFAAFMSSRALTGYDNRDARTGKPDQEVYLYDSSSEHLTCASCNPTGARPDGLELRQFNGVAALNLADVQSSESLASVAANLPTTDAISHGSGIYQPRLLFNDGRLFFNSSDALVPQDVNGNEDVYEFELPGDGTCTTSSVAYSERSGGCVDLISSGASPVESGFLDASESGDDVFFVTAETLVPQDLDTAFDVYDAHVCSTEASCATASTSPPECTTAEACRAAPMPQSSIFGAPPSATFSGAGSPPESKQGKTGARKGQTSAQKRRKALKACQKEHGKRRRACERKARKRYSVKGSSSPADRLGQSRAKASRRGRR
jgi:DNA-binding beta-propeller fold protein YncE